MFLFTDHCVHVSVHGPLYSCFCSQTTVFMSVHGPVCSCFFCSRTTVFMFLFTDHCFSYFCSLYHHYSLYCVLFIFNLQIVRFICIFLLISLSSMYLNYSVQLKALSLYLYGTVAFHFFWLFLMRRSVVMKFKCPKFLHVLACNFEFRELLFIAMLMVQTSCAEVFFCVVPIRSLKRTLLVPL